MAPRGASESKRMRSTDSSALVPVVHRFANAAGVPAERTTATGNCRRYCGENAPTEKRFSPVDLLASHAADIRCSIGMSASSSCGGTTSNVAPSRCARRCDCRSSARAAPSSENSASGTRASSPILSAASPRSTYSASRSAPTW